MRIRKRLQFFGQVQGVGFRFRAVNAARALGLTGWVANEWDGSVSMEVQGDPEEIEALIEKLKGGTFIRIERIEEEVLPVETESGFDTR
ncbi:MAG: acylphosphatase [Lachnospiraceae bacterium]|nr:acylphosphatase [Lachnospiraceae bacterium]